MKKPLRIQGSVYKENGTVPQLTRKQAERIMRLHIGNRFKYTEFGLSETKDFWFITEVRSYYRY